MAAHAQEMAFKELICSDLKLDPCQWEERSSFPGLQNDPRCLEIDCLVHTDWLTCAKTGRISSAHTPSLTVEEIHWYLQPSCDSAPPTPWQRVHVTCLRKEESYHHAVRHLVPQTSDFSRDSIHEFLSQVAQENYLVSWRETLGPLQEHPPSHSHTTHPFTSNALIRQIIKQLYHIDQATAHSNTGNQNETQKVHANLTPMLASMESKTAFYFIFPYTRFSLLDVAFHSPAMFEDSIAKALFVLYQFLQLLKDVHHQGITLGDLSLASVSIDARLWVQLRPHPLHMIGAPPFDTGSGRSQGERTRTSHSPTPQPGIVCPASVAGSTHTLTDDHTHTNDHTPFSWEHTYTVPSLSLSEGVSLWRAGGLSNFDYLMLLNHHVGRVIGDPNNHPIFPWVTDFTSQDTGYRDLSRSKHFLTKGEDQLDFTYISAQEEMRRSPDQDPLVPHHIGDISSDVTYYVYLARRTPKEMLCLRVRPRWVPEEYPVSMEKMYIWSPDECIPEFFIDTTIFKSIHSDLSDLQLPRWAESPEDFIRYHRNVLEGDAVSAQLHHWIDLVFGYKLTGHDAIKAKNVYLSVVDKHKNPTNSGIVQLFKSSHPKRTVSSSAPFILQEWSSYLNKSSVSNVASFPIEQATPLTPSLSSKEGGASKEPKTLESILNQESAKKRARPEKDGDNVPFQGQENQEEEFYGSFEHVNVPDLNSTKASTASSASIDTGAKEFPEKVMPGLKVRGNSVVLPGNYQPRFRLPVVNRIIRQRRPTLGEEHVYDWQGGEVSLPKEAHLLDRLTRLEELSHFVSKSCKDEGQLFLPQAATTTVEKDCHVTSECPASRVQGALERLVGGDPSHYPSFEERVGLDVTAAVCTVVQLCCMRQLRAAIPINAPLQKRVGIIKKLLKSGQLKLPSFLLGLVEFVLSPDMASSTPVTHLPSLTPSLLLQPFLPVIPFPTYFDPLYKFIYRLEQLLRDTTFGQMTFNFQRLKHITLPTHNQEQLDRLLELISADLGSLLGVISNEGFPLLLLHLFPFFTHPDTSFDAIFSFLDPLARRMGRRNVERLFSLPLIHLFDTATPPHQRARLLCRTTAHMLIGRFGLSAFIGRFLGFYLEAILEPLRMTNTKPIKRLNNKIMRMASQSILTLEMMQSQAFESGRTRNTDLSFSMALSDGRHGFDTEKEYESSNESDDELGPEASILAKATTMYAAPVGGVNDTDSSLLTPLTVITEHTTLTPAPSSPDKSPHTDLLQPSRSVEDVRADKPDSRPTSPTPLYDGFLTTSIVSEAFEGYRDIRSDSFGGRSSVGDTRDEVVSSEEEEEEELPIGESVFPAAECDPVTTAVNARIAELAADSVCWLMRRLGPILSTQHIVKPLLDGLHRCFSGVLHTGGGSQFPVLKCLSFFAETYGEDVILKLYLSRAESMVGSATSRMTSKSEAGVAASLALVRIAIRQLTHTTLQFIGKDLCDNYFLPLIQLLSSQTTFPSGGAGRSAVCRSMVDLLLSLGERLGREEAINVLTDTLQGFFSCFSSVHSNEEETQLWGTPHNRLEIKNGLPDKSQRVAADDLFDISNTPTSSSPIIRPGELAHSNNVVPTPVDIHPLTAEPIGHHDNSSTDKLLASESYQQLCATFSQAMAHAGYIPLCRLLGQVQLNSKLLNTDLIEYIAYKHDNEDQTTTLPRALADQPDHEDSELSSPIGSDSDEDVNFDAMRRVGPVAAVTDLGADQAELQRTVWFVDLEEEDIAAITPLPQPSEKPPLTLSSADAPPTRPDSISYREALFEAKFSSFSQPTTVSLDTPLTTVGKGVANMIAGVATIATPTLGKMDDNDLTLKGAWSTQWERQLQRSVHSRDGFRHFRGAKLQTFTGHRSVVRSLAVSDSESFFVSTSKDKTAKVWKLGNYGDGDGTTMPSLTYNGHSKTVLGVELLEGLGQVVSCDGAAHVWDVESGYCVHQFQPSHGTLFTALAAQSSSQPLIAMATSDLQLRYYDVRTLAPLQTWKLQFPTGGTIRYLASAENWIAVGNHNGHINTLDVRTGELLSSWKPSDFYPNPATSWNDNMHQLRSTQRGNLVTSVGQGLLSLWRPSYRKLLHPLKCPAHPVQCVEVCGDQLISVSNNGHLVVHEGFETSDGRANHVMRVRNRGLSSMATLPENKMLLLGMDVGTISLLA